MPPLSLDQRIRLAAFEWLRAQVDLHGDVLPWTILSRGFELDGERVPLVSMQGIFKPRLLSGAPLSIRTSAEGPYSDSFGPDGLLRYAYRGTDPEHRDNRGLRFAMAREIPLVYFHGILEGKYLAAWPVFVVGDDRGALRFTVALDDARHVSAGLRLGRDEVADSLDPESAARRSYVTATLRVRLHQRAYAGEIGDPAPHSGVVELESIAGLLAGLAHVPRAVGVEVSVRVARLRARDVVRERVLVREPVDRLAFDGGVVAATAAGRAHGVRSLPDRASRSRCP